jgi:hypothetical protein
VLEGLYRKVASIEEKVEEISDGLQELIEVSRDRAYHAYDWRNGLDNTNHE